MRWRIPNLLFGAILAAVVAGCDARAATFTPPPTMDRAAGTALPAPETVSAAATDDVPEDAVTGREATRAALAARQALADEKDVALAEVELVDVEPVVWPNSALGCPQPDAMYLQVLTPGYRVTVSAGGQAVTYHTDRSDPPALVRCDAPGGTASGTARD